MFGRKRNEFITKTEFEERRQFVNISFKDIDTKIELLLSLKSFLNEIADDIADLKKDLQNLHNSHNRLAIQFENTTRYHHPEFQVGQTVTLRNWMNRNGDLFDRTVKLIRDLGYGWRVLDEVNEEYIDANNSSLFPIEHDEPEEEFDELANETVRPFDPSILYSSTLTPVVGDTAIVGTRASSNLYKYTGQYGKIVDTNGSWAVVEVDNKKLMLSPGEYVVIEVENMEIK